MKKICKYPFSYIEIHPKGTVACCCSSYTDDYFFGNVFKESFEEIWNGKKAQKFRQDILDGKYSFCHLDMCSGIDTCKYMSKKDAKMEMPYPKIVNFSIDETCNVKCVMCRDRIKATNKTRLAKLEKLLDTTFIPMLKNAELLQMNGEGEVFASSLCKKFIKMAAETYPNLKFELITNGQLCTKENLEALKITDRIERITFSVHGSTKETYEKVMRGGKFEVMLKNLKYLNSLRKKGKLENLSMTYVISSMNYKDLPGFVKLAEELGISAQLREFMNWGEASQMNIDFDKYDIINKNHPEHKAFCELLKQPIFKSELCLMDDVIRKCSLEK